MAPAKIFISHISEDKVIATSLKNLIEPAFTDAVQLFVSSDGDIPPGTHWQQKILEELQAANLVIVVCTNKALSRPWINFEAGGAMVRGAPVIPVCWHGAKPSNLPPPFGSLEAIDLGSTNDIDRLLAAVAKTAGKETPKSNHIDLTGNLPVRYVDESHTGSATSSDNPFEQTFTMTDRATEHDLIQRISSAKHKITVLGLTRNFYFREPMRDHLLKKADEIPITLFLMDPFCESRIDRYRIEPLEAAFADPNRFVEFVETPMKQLLAKAKQGSFDTVDSGLQIYYFNFPCSFAIEEIDDSCRVMFYGHGKRGTEGPVFVFKAGTPYFDYFSSQLRWLEKLAAEEEYLPWTGPAKQINVTRLQP